MSQRAEKYARNMERRVDKLEDQAGRLEESRDKIGRKLGEYGHRLAMIESDISRAAALHDNEVEVRRRGEVHAVQDSRLGLLALLPALELLPVQGVLLRGKHMGVAVDQLFTDAVHHVVKAKGAGLPGHRGVEHHLEQDIAQLLLQIVHVHAVDGVGGLIGLLQHIGADGLMGLGPVPGAAPGSAEQLHDFQQVLHAVIFRHLKIYHNFASLSSLFIYFYSFS